MFNIYQGHAEMFCLAIFAFIV